MYYMDEVDFLCDRIVIMSEGWFKCCGSSFFFKVGYLLNFFFFLRYGWE